MEREGIGAGSTTLRVVPRKLVLIVIDGLAPATLEAAIGQGAAPTLAYLRERGSTSLAVSAFPSLTPVCLSAIATGRGPDGTRIPGLHWYHRGEGRFVEYGSSFEATVVAGAKQSVEDSMMNLNHLHLSPKVETLFESTEDAGLVAAAINFYVWRGRVRHPLKHPFVRRVARRTGFFDAAYGPTRFHFGELFGSDRTGAPRNLGVGGRNDDHAGAVGRWLVARDGFDFLLFYLPETDAASHRRGPDAIIDVVARADDNIAKLMSAAGGPEAFLERYAVIVAADHGQSLVERDDDLREAFADQRLFLSRARSDPATCDLAVAASNRAGMVYRLAGEIGCEEIAGRLVERPSVDLVAWLDDGAATALRGGRRLRFAPGGRECDLRDGAWMLEGDRETLALEPGAPVRSSEYPNALERLWSLLTCVNAGEVVVSATAGWEFRDAGGQSHLGGGSHGSLHVVDSLVPLWLVGLDDDRVELPAQPSITDIAPLIRRHFGLADATRRHPSLPTGAPSS
jgi:hypothetical protein